MSGQREGVGVWSEGGVSGQKRGRGWFVSGQRGVSVRGGVSVWSEGVSGQTGVWSEGGEEADPPQMATAAVGTHSTGMHSC